MSKWNLAELRELCRQKNIPESAIYQNSLEWRWRQADFHAKKAQEIWAELGAAPFTFGDQRYDEAVFSYDAYVVACVQALHSMVDILVQIINVVILETRFSESQVSAKRITEFMEKKGIGPQVTERMIELLNSYEFRYLDAFCNTSKHRRLINTRFRAEYGGDYRNEAGMKFRQFDYKGITYPETWGCDVLERYRYHIGQLVTNVGLSINKFLAEI
jgi:hypothetical protein